jgi:hypothetical protein
MTVLLPYIPEEWWPWLGIAALILLIIFVVSIIEMGSE